METTEERGDAWLAEQEARLKELPFEKLLGWIRWNDPNGDWRDEDLVEYETTKEDLVATLMSWVEDTMETPEEWRRGAQRY